MRTCWRVSGREPPRHAQQERAQITVTAKKGRSQMAENDSSKKKDQWEKADVVGKWLIPVTVALATVFFNSGQKAREAKEKSFEVAISILQAPKTDDTKQLREWALSVFTDVT